MQDNEIIERIATSPQSLSDADILRIMADPELLDLYEAVVMMSKAVVDCPEFGIDESLAQLHAEISGPKIIHSFHNRFTKSARRAAAIIAISVSLAAMAFFTASYVKTINSDHAESQIETVGQDELIEPASASTSDKLQYDNAPLAEILDDISERYHCKVLYKESVDRQSRFHITIPDGASLEEVVELLNAFDEFKISIKGDTLIVE